MEKCINIINCKHHLCEQKYDVKSSELSDLLATGIELEVIKDIAKRQQKGIAKYGVTVDENYLTLKQWLQHAYEEHLDACIYLKKAIKECG